MANKIKECISFEHKIISSFSIRCQVSGRNRINQPQARHFGTTCISTLSTESCGVFATYEETRWKVWMATYVAPNYFTVNEGSGYQVISPHSPVYPPMMPPGIPTPGYPYQPWAPPRVIDRGDIRAEQVVASFPGAEGEEKERLVHTVCACA